MHLDIISPEKTLFSGDIELIQLPGNVGYFEILRNHAPIVSTLKNGNIKVKDANGVFFNFKIESGVVEALRNQVNVLVETL